MISDQLGLALHERYTLDQPLTAEEQDQLDAWYVQNDSAEAAQLQQITLENDVIRQEIASLKQQLAAF